MTSKRINTESIKDTVPSHESMWLRLKSAQTIAELADAIPKDIFAQAASWLMMYWISAPIAMMVVNMLFFQPDELSLYIQMLPLNSSLWSMMLYHAGYLGCLLGIVACIHSIITNKSISLRSLLKEKPFVFLLCAMLVWAGISTLASSSLSLSLLGSSYRQEGFLTLIAYAGIYALGYLIMKNEIVWRRVVSWFVISALIHAILVLIENQVIYRLLGINQTSGIFYNQNHYGYYLCLALMSTVMLLTTTVVPQTKKANPFIFYYTSFTILAYALIHNGSFGPYLAVWSGLLCLLGLAIWRYKRHAIRIVIAILIVVICSNINHKDITQQFQILGSDVKTVIQTPNSADHAGSSRWVLWRHGLTFITQKPLLGYGLEMIGEQYTKVGIHQDRIHNTFLHIAATIGVPGLLLYASSLMSTMFIFFKNRENQRLVVCTLFALVFAYLVNSFFGNSMFYTSPYYLFFLGAGHSLVTHTKDKKSKVY